MFCNVVLDRLITNVCYLISREYVAILALGECGSIDNASPSWWVNCYK